MKARPLAILAALAAAAALALPAMRYDIEAPTPTGGVSRVQLKAADIARLDFSLDKSATLTLVRGFGGATFSSAVLTNAPGVGTRANLGVVGTGDCLQLTSATNAAASVYIIGK